MISIDIVFGEHVELGDREVLLSMPVTALLPLMLESFEQTP